MSWHRVIARLLSLLRPLWGVMAFSALMRTINQTAAVALLGIGAWGVSEIIEKDHLISTVMVLLIGTGLVKGVARYLEQFSGHYVAFRLLALLRNRFYQAIEPLSPAGLTESRSGDLVSRVVADVDRVEVFYAHTIAPVVTAVVVPTAALAMVAYYSRYAALALFPFLLLVGLVIPLWAAWRDNEGSSRVRTVGAEVNAHLTDSVQGIREVLSFAYGTRRRQEIRHRSDQISSAQHSLARIAAIRTGLSDFAVWGGVSAVLMVGLWHAKRNTADIADILPLVAVAIGGFAPVRAVEQVAGDLGQAIAAARRLFDLMDRQPAVSDGPGATIPTADIRFEDVWFRYGDEWTLLGIDFQIPAGSTVAVVGPSGSGKSTLTNLLLRFWDPDRGRVTVGGVDLRDATLHEVRAQAALVSQRTHLFTGTIGENLTMANPNADHESLQTVLQAAELAEFVASQPLGLDTPVGEMGSTLSGGQRQRLALARALVADAPILVLDEATSNLDVHTEQALQSSLLIAMEGRTVLTIAHRLSTVVDADMILVLDNGKVIERGTHHELLESGGLYARMWSRQQDEIDDTILT